MPLILYINNFTIIYATDYSQFTICGEKLEGNTDKFSESLLICQIYST